MPTLNYLRRSERPCAGWLFAARAPGDGEWIFKHAACGTAVLLSQGLHFQADARSVSSSVHNTHAHTHFLLIPVQSTAGFQRDVVAFPFHCYRREMLTRITGAAAGVGPAQDCSASSHSVPLPRFSHSSCESRVWRSSQLAFSYKCMKYDNSYRPLEQKPQIFLTLDHLY